MDCVINKAISMGFETAIEVNKDFFDANGKQWGIFIASSSNTEMAWGLPVYLLKSGDEIKVADYDETFTIMCAPTKA